MRFLIDAQLPFALARRLADLGHEAHHVGDLGLAGAADEAIWSRAVRDDCALVTKDEDFARRKVLTQGGPKIVWIRIPNTRRRVLLEWFTANLPDILAALARGEELIEIVSTPKT